MPLCSTSVTIARLGAADLHVLASPSSRSSVTLGSRPIPSAPLAFGKLAIAIPRPFRCGTPDPESWSVFTSAQPLTVLRVDGITSPSYRCPAWSAAAPHAADLA